MRLYLYIERKHTRTFGLGHVSNDFFAGLAMGRRRWAGPGFSHPSTFHMMGPARPGSSNIHLVGCGPARPINFSEDGPRLGRAHYTQISRPGPNPPTKKISRPGPAHDIGSEASQTRAIYGPARHFRGPTRRFDDPGYGPAHMLSRTKRCTHVS